MSHYAYVPLMLVFNGMFNRKYFSTFSHFWRQEEWNYTWSTKSKNTPYAEQYKNYYYYITLYVYSN